MRDRPYLQSPDLRPLPHRQVSLWDVLSVGIVAGVSGVVGFEALSRRAGERVLPVLYASKMFGVVLIGILTGLIVSTFR